MSPSTNLNLIRDPWIPIRRRSGALERIAPRQVTEGDDPVVALASPRSDFDGALAQFLVGLLQSACPPESARQWRRWADQPPTTEALREAMAPLEPHFDLLGDGPRFLQDRTLQESEAKFQPVSNLLIELGSDTLFVHPEAISRLCLPCAAAALFTLQTNAPSGGRGHRTGLRGGGPMTTLVVVDETRHGLWGSLWFNVLETDTFRARAGCTPDLEGPEHRFPWLVATRTSEKKTGTTGPQHIHPLQLFWGMPRRIRLHTEEDSSEPCSLCGSSSAPVADYITKNLGVNYEGDFEHPLSPHRQDKSGHLFAVKGSPRGLSYRDWLGFAVNHQEAGLRTATAVDVLYNTPARKERAHRAGGLRLWAFGYDMDNMKARSWNEGRIPVFLADTPEHQAALARQAQLLIEGATQAGTIVYHAVKALIHRRPQDLKGDPSEASVRFRQEIEAPFYQHLAELNSTLGKEPEGGTPDPGETIRRRWHRQLVTVAQSVFDQYTGGGHFQGINPAQQANAWNTMRKNLFGKKMHDLLDLKRRKAKESP